MVFGHIRRRNYSVPPPTRKETLVILAIVGSLLIGAAVVATFLATTYNAPPSSSESRWRTPAVPLALTCPNLQDAMLDVIALKPHSKLQDIPPLRRWASTIKDDCQRYYIVGWIDFYEARINHNQAVADYLAKHPELLH